MPQEMEVDYEKEAQEAYKELEQEKSGVKKPEEPKTEPARQPVTEPEPSPTPKEDEPQPTQPEEKKEDAESTEEESGITQESGKPEEKEVEVKEEISADEVQNHALKHGLTYVEAKEDIEKTKAVIEKYKNDPLEMARALRSQQSAYDRLKAEKENKVQPTQSVPTREQIKPEVDAYVAKNQMAILDQYRKNHPARTELMSNEAILEWAAEDVVRDYQEKATEHQNKLKRTAEEKREQALSSIPKEDLKFLPDVKIVLGKTADYQIADPSFDIRDIVNWAKGQRYNDDIKAAEARGFKRAQEGSKILGAKTGGGGSAPRPVVASSGLNEDQKKRAIEMFEDDGISPEEAYKLFQEIHKKDLEKNPSFVA